MRNRSAMLALALVAFVALGAVGCGGKSESERQREADAAKNGRGAITCDGPALSDARALPARFPRVKGFTATRSRAAGPSTIANGYIASPLDDAFSAFETSLKSAGYSIEKTDHEEHDAEIEYRGKGSAGEGQVALRDACDNGRTSVQVTNRPS